MVLSHTALFVGLLTYAHVFLTFWVGNYRRVTGILFQHDNDEVLLRRIRAHGNFTETVPITLIAMAVAELGGAPSWLLLTGGSALLLGRTAHVVALVRGGTGIGRAIGMLLTFGAMLLFATYGLMIFGEAGVF
ncbi:MAG: hypothetical protein COA62_14250 [Rhodobiaceae bacterium]|nr:MAG: hypothetical protein COA62_14250 [Rhodobiaceae bacterium]